MPLLRRAARARVRRPRHDAARQQLPRARAAPTRWSPSTRCAPTSASAAGSCSSSSSRASEEIFSDYAYFSSYSTSWLEHCPPLRRRRWSPGSGSGEPSLVVEIASNDGYLLQYFATHGVPVLGIEPAANVAAARDRAGRPDARRVLRRRDRDRAARGVRRRPAARQQRARPRARPQRLRRRHEGAAEATAARSRWSSRICCG